MQEAANKQKRMTLKTLHEMLDGMSVELAEKVQKIYEKPSMKVVLLKSRSSLLMTSPDLPTGPGWPGGNPW